MRLDLSVALERLSVRERASLFASLVETLVQANRLHMHHAREALSPLPRLYSSEVRYRADPTWKDMIAVLESGTGDCKDLVAYRLAEMRDEGVDARLHVVFYPLGDVELFHLQIQTPWGAVEDPSLPLGMQPLRLALDSSSPLSHPPLP